MPTKSSPTPILKEQRSAPVCPPVDGHTGSQADPHHFRLTASLAKDQPNRRAKFCLFHVGGISETQTPANARQCWRGHRSASRPARSSARAFLLQARKPEHYSSAQQTVLPIPANQRSSLPRTRPLAVRHCAEYNHLCTLRFPSGWEALCPSTSLSDASASCTSVQPRQ